MHHKRDSICSRCVSDYAIRNFIEEHAALPECSFCRRKSTSENIAASAGIVLQTILDGISYDYEEVSCPSDVAETYDIYNLIFENRIDVSSRPDVQKWLIHAIGGKRRWQIRSREIEGLLNGWDDFSEAIKSNSRFFPAECDTARFNNRPSSNSYIHPRDVLEQLGKLFRLLRLSTYIPVGTKMFRARAHQVGERLSNAEELGPPPAWKCRQGRMNAAGIPVFYSALDMSTAIMESLGNASACSVGEFELLSGIHVLNLVDFGKEPSIFDCENRILRDALEFLEHFQREISLPMEKDDENKIQYTTTQFVSEFIRYRFVDGQGRRMAGILYPSALNFRGKNLVLFTDRHGVEGVDVEPGGAEASPRKVLRLTRSETIVLSNWDTNHPTPTRTGDPESAGSLASKTSHDK